MKQKERRNNKKKSKIIQSLQNSLSKNQFKNGIKKTGKNLKIR